MPNLKERQKDSEHVRGLHKSSDNTYNEQAGGVKVVGPIAGDLRRLFKFGATAEPLTEPVRPGSVIAFYNNSATTTWLSIGLGAVAPAVPADTEPSSIALKPNDYTILALPPDATTLRSSSTNVIAYWVNDDSYIR